MDTVRGFLGSQGPAALFDLPWIPIYLAFHLFFCIRRWVPLTFCGAFVLTGVLTVQRDPDEVPLSLSTRKAAMARRPVGDAATPPQPRKSAQDDGIFPPAVRSPGSTTPIGNIWSCRPRRTTSPGPLLFRGVARAFHDLLQSAVLGLGASACSRANSPPGRSSHAPWRPPCSRAVVCTIGNWKPFVAARMAYQRLRDTVVALAATDAPMSLPAPVRPGVEEKITVAAPRRGRSS